MAGPRAVINHEMLHRGSAGISDVRCGLPGRTGTLPMIYLSFNPFNDHMMTVRIDSRIRRGTVEGLKN